jgi:predicted DNA-binding transcriptional regulator AlpA
MPVNPPEERPPLLVSCKEVARLTGLCERSVWAFSASGKMPPPIALGGRRLWRYSEITAWVRDGCPAGEGASR